MSRKSRRGSSIKARHHVPKRSLIRETETIPEGALVPTREDPERRSFSDKEVSALTDAQFMRLLALSLGLTQQKRQREEEAREAGETPASPIMPAPVVQTESPYSGTHPERYVSVTTETYDQGAGAYVIYGATAARTWVGNPGQSELISVAMAHREPILKDEQDEMIDRLERALLLEIQQRIHTSTGLKVAEHTLAERVEYLWGWECDGTLMQRVRMFVAGYRRPELHIPATRLTLADIKQRAQEWRDGPAKILEGN